MNRSSEIRSSRYQSEYHDYIVEETFYISFDEPISTRKSLLYGIQCGVAAAMRTEAVRSIFKVTFVNSFQYHSYLPPAPVCRRKRVRREVVAFRFSSDVHSSMAGRVALVFQRKGSVFIAGKAHTVDGFPLSAPLCHITRLGIYSLISQIIHFIEKNTIKPLKPVFRGLTMLCQTVLILPLGLLIMPLAFSVNRINEY